MENKWKLQISRLREKNLVTLIKFHRLTKSQTTFKLICFLTYFKDFGLSLILMTWRVLWGLLLSFQTVSVTMISSKLGKMTLVGMETSAWSKVNTSVALSVKQDSKEPKLVEQVQLYLKRKYIFFNFTLAISLQALGELSWFETKGNLPVWKAFKIIFNRKGTKILSEISNIFSNL